MSKWKNHTPDGTQDTLVDETKAFNRIQKNIMQVFAGFGYGELKTPTFEFYDVFEGNMDQEQMLKFFDAQGRILVLRPDITTPIARLYANKLADEMPKRFCYSGSAYRNRKMNAGLKLTEFTQSGIELINSAGSEADAEVIAVCIKALLAAGLDDFLIEIGQVEFFKEIMKQSGLNEEQTEKIRVLIDQKNTLGVYETLSNLSVDEELKQVINDLPQMFGDISIIEKAERLNVSNAAKAALMNLKKVYEILEDYGLSQYISIDLGMVKGLDYYTGIIFKGYTRGLGFNVCGGGRYDGLIGKFGTSVSATGVAIGIEMLLSALYRQGKIADMFSIDAFVCYKENSRKEAFTLADQLRENGEIVEMQLHPMLLDEAVRYAAQKSIKKIYYCADGIVKEVASV